MAQNRNKLIGLLIGNISNAIVHEILGEAIDNENIRNHYNRGITETAICLFLSNSG